MSDDWKPGDLAVCVDADPCWCCGSSGGLVTGNVYRVVAVLCGGSGLNVEGVSPKPHVGIVARKFRRIRPDEHEPCEEEFKVLVKRKAPSPEERHERIMGAIFGRFPGSRPSDGATACLHHSASIRSAGR